MSNNKQSQQRLLTIAVLVIMVLLLINAFLLFNKVSQGKVIEEQKTELTEAETLKTELEKQYHDAQAELEAMKGSNEELNAIIDQQKLELEQQRDKVNRLLRDGKELNRARAELRNFKSQVEEYLARISQLTAENESLRSERDDLSTQARSLSQNLDSAAAANRQLSDEKQALTAEKQALSEERSRLSDKVNLASVIKVNSLEITPLKERSSGKDVKKKYAKNVEKLKICFKTTDNLITKAGTEQFHVRVLTPRGETMSAENTGGGKIFNRDTGEEMLFSFSKEVEYDNRSAQVCHVWSPSLESFSQGKYTVEVYNKGHRAGTGQVVLK
jgi:chromosome segregation ATPase